MADELEVMRSYSRKADKSMNAQESNHETTNTVEEESVALANKQKLIHSSWFLEISLS